MPMRSRSIRRRNMRRHRSVSLRIRMGNAAPYPPQNAYQQMPPKQQPPVYQNPYEQFAAEDAREQADLFSPRAARPSSQGAGMEQPVRNARPARPDAVREQKQRRRMPEEDKRSRSRDYYDDFEDEDDVDPKMEKIMTVLMIVAAVIIAVVAFLVIGKFVGLFGKSGASEETNIEAESGMVAVPDLVGKTFNEASELLTEAGLTASAERAESTEYDKDYIISQDIEAGTQVATGTKLKLVISSGKVVGGVAVPDLVGKSEAEAKVLLDAEGLVLAVETTPNPSVEAGKIVSQTPMGATTAPKGSTVTV